MSAIERIGSDVRALLVERYEQWQRTVPWYRRAPEPIEVVPMTLALERLVRELRAELAAAKARVSEREQEYGRMVDELTDRAEDLREELGRERLERKDERHDDRAELARVSAILNANNSLMSSALRELAYAARAKASVVREAKRIAAELAEERDAHRQTKENFRFYWNKHSDWSRAFVAIVFRLAKAGVKLPTEEEEAAGRTTIVFVGELARSYRKARLALLALQQRREVDAAELAWLRKVEAAARGLVATLPECTNVDWAEGDMTKHVACESVATKANGRGGPRYCDAHAPEGCPDYPRAGAVRALVELFTERPPGTSAGPALPTGDPTP